MKLLAGIYDRIECEVLAREYSGKWSGPFASIMGIMSKNFVKVNALLLELVDSVEQLVTFPNAEQSKSSEKQKLF